MARPISARDRRCPVRESGQPTGFRRRDRLRASRATRSAGPACSDPTTFCGLDELGPEVIGQRLGPDLPAGSSSPISGVDDTSAKASRETRWSGGWTQQALSWRPTVLEVVVRRYRCSGCGHVWHQDTSAANSRSRSMSSKAPGGPPPGIDAPAIATPATGKSPIRSRRPAGHWAYDRPA